MRFSDVAVLNIFVLYFFYIRTVVKFDIYIIDKKLNPYIIRKNFI